MATPVLDDLAQSALPPRLLEKLLAIPYSPQVPQVKQAQFLLDYGLEALYGGAAGGGKSSALLMAALQFIEVPGYAAMLFRKSYADLSLPGAIMDRAKDWLGGQPGVRWSEIERKFTFASGATLGFGYIQNENDRLRYQGAELTFVGFDEVTQFKERDYLYLFSRIRRPKEAYKALSRVPLRMRCATNPGGPGHRWVHERFVVPWERHKHLTERHATQIAQGYPSTPPEPLPRTFVPATLLDNRFIDTTEYRKALSNLDPVTRAQLESGNWNIRPDGRVFRKEWFIPVDFSDVPPDCVWVRYWDLAATDANPGKDPDWTAGLLLGWSKSTKLFYVRDLVRFRSSPGVVESTIIATAERDRQSPSHVTIRMEQEPGASGKTVIYFYRQKLLGHDFGGDLPSGNKIVRAELVANKAEPKSDVPYGQVRMVRDHWNEVFLDELEIFPDGEHDDTTDALSGALAVLVKKVGMAPTVNLKNGSLTQTNQWAYPTPTSLRR
jgi:predicted phage terminase large subunit-like protein